LASNGGVMPLGFAAFGGIVVHLQRPDGVAGHQGVPNGHARQLGLEVQDLHEWHPLGATPVVNDDHTPSLRRPRT
jgi:hypothetical protein